MQTIPLFPFVSIIIPIRNEAAHIQRCLEAVMAQNYASDRLEVLVIDGLSTDGTRESILQMMAGHTKFPIYRLDNPAHIVPTALNIGLSKAKGDIIVRVDGHCEIAPDYVRRCVAHLQMDLVDGVGGAIETTGDTYTAQAIAIAMSSTFGVGNSSFRTKRNMHLLTDSVPFPAYKRETLSRVGCYDEEMLCNEDDEYNYRLSKLGMKLLLASDIKSRYYCRGSLNSLWRQYYKYGYWKVRIMQKHPRQMSLRQFVPPVFVLGLLGSIILALFLVSRPELALSEVEGSVLGLLSSIVPLLYLIVNLFASLYTAYKHGWQYLPSLPFIFAILHLSYGLGFLAGLLKFWNRWGD
jgi:glycosyltransferase involved in cell wall biosynthesis